MNNLKACTIVSGGEKKFCLHTQIKLDERSHLKLALTKGTRKTSLILSEVKGTGFKTPFEIALPLFGDAVFADEMLEIARLLHLVGPKWSDASDFTRKALKVLAIPEHVQGEIDANLKFLTALQTDQERLLRLMGESYRKAERTAIKNLPEDKLMASFDACREELAYLVNDTSRWIENQDVDFVDSVVIYARYLETCAKEVIRRKNLSAQERQTVISNFPQPKSDEPLA